MDFIVQLPKTASGYDAIVVFVDRLTKMARFAACHTTATSQDTAVLFCENVVRHHGVPQELVSDRGSVFLSAFWNRVCARLCIKHAKSTAFHPQTDGQTERMNRVLEEMLRHYISPTCDDWDEHLFAVEFAVNNAVNASTGVSPFYMMYGEHPHVPISVELRTADRSADADEFITRITSIVAGARQALLDAQARQAQYHDRKRTEVTFKVGDRVLLSTKNIKLRVQKDTKLLPKYIGPFPIVSAVPNSRGPVSFELELPPRYKIHRVFHSSLLKLYKESKSRPFGLPLPVDWITDDEPVYEVEKVLLHRDRRLAGNRSRREYLLKWKGYGPEHNTWEKAGNLLRCDDVLKEYWAWANSTTRTL
jgi:hypothetical protein